VFIDENFEISIADFGLSKVLDPGLQNTVAIGTPIFMAPELQGDLKYSYPVDVYAYAVTIFWTFTNSTELTCGLVKNPSAFLMRIADGVRFKRPRDDSISAIPDPIWELIERCWAQSPHDRPMFKDVVAMWDNEALWFPGTDAARFREYQARIMPEPCRDPSFPAELDEISLTTTVNGRTGLSLSRFAQSGDLTARNALTRSMRTTSTTTSTPSAAKPFQFKRKS
jgi:serine/threonine protein kinase